MLRSILEIVLGFCFEIVAAAHAGLFVQDGQEYEYQSSVISAAGTMDVATHSSGEMYRMKVRIQVRGMTLNVAVSYNHSLLELLLAKK